MDKKLYNAIFTVVKKSNDFSYAQTFEFLNKKDLDYTLNLIQETYEKDDNLQSLFNRTTLLNEVREMLLVYRMSWIKNVELYSND